MLSILLINSMSNLAIIPARGGSKRIPRKNVKDFLGRPIISYSIQVALESDLFDEVMVSTDDLEIAEIAVKYGAKVPFIRSAEASTDYATTIDVIRETISVYMTRLNKVFDLACCIYPTAPLIQVPHLKSGLGILRTNNFDIVLPIVAFEYPVWRGVEIYDDCKMRMVWPKYQNSRSQDLKKLYHDAGQWYWLNTNQIGETLFTKNTGFVLLAEYEVQDIDDLKDWILAEMKYKLLNESQNLHPSRR